MDRRSLLAHVGVALGAGLGGCTVGLGDPHLVGPLDLTVTNGSTHAYDVSVTVRDRLGALVRESDLGRLAPSTGLSVSFDGLPNRDGPYEVVVDGGDWRASYGWGVATCAGYDVTVTLSGDGDVSTAGGCLG